MHCIVINDTSSVGGGGTIPMIIMIPAQTVDIAIRLSSLLSSMPPWNLCVGVL